MKLDTDREEERRNEWEGKKRENEKSERKRRTTKEIRRRDGNHDRMEGRGE